jgi:hypothetical protein
MNDEERTPAPEGWRTFNKTNGKYSFNPVVLLWSTPGYNLLFLFKLACWSHKFKLIISTFFTSIVLEELNHGDIKHCEKCNLKYIQWIKENT